MRWLYGKLILFTRLLVALELLDLVRGHLTYDGSKKICGYSKGPICCPGWRNGINDPCSIAVCAGNCGDRGKCVRPNVCQCADRRWRFSCESEENDEMQSDQASAYCPENCNRRGTCLNGVCKCDHGYTGSECEVAIQSKCFARLSRGLCTNPVQRENVTTYITQEMCCNGIGAAWGEPCIPCRTSYCGRGYYLQDGSCRDINECDIPGVCRGGQCFNSEGFYSCECPNGYKYDEESLKCMPVWDACKQNPHRCSPGGKCLPLLNGDFRCLCNWRHIVAPDQQSCLPKRQMTFDMCKLYSSSICKNGQCIPRGTSYECVCNDGFVLSEDRKTCRHLDTALERQLTMYASFASHKRPEEQQAPEYFNPRIQHDSAERENLQNSRPHEQYQHPYRSYSKFRRTRRHNPCGTIEVKRNCAGGFCLNLGGGQYTCECRPGYESTDGGKICRKIADYQPHGRWQNDPSDRYTNRPNPTKTTEHPTSQYAAGLSSYVNRQAEWSQHNPVISRLERVPPCSLTEIRRRCAGGFCLNLGGSAYVCECFAGYRAIENGRACEKISGNRHDRPQSDSIGLNTPSDRQRPELVQSGPSVKESGDRSTAQQTGNNILYGSRHSPCDDIYIRRNCAGGFCLNLGGTAYRCECTAGYRAVNGGHMCVSTTASSK
ncbi:unnamed protein product [Calicophoron daubneyi]|uniref:Uncharacterized protein n=1 Tax=Calicophoron daubneyi TaxID=300641 RepID=A0AAV2TMJ3_CALDB